MEWYVTFFLDFIASAKWNIISEIKLGTIEIHKMSLMSYFYGGHYCELSSEE